MTGRASEVASEATAAERAAVIELWGRCGLTRPWNDPVLDFDTALAADHAAVLVLRRDGALAACALVGHDGHRGAVYYVAVDPDRRGLGLGPALMGEVEGWLARRGVWKLNLLVREGNEAAAGFYTALGYTDQRCTVFGKRLDGRPDRAAGPA